MLMCGEERKGKKVGRGREEKRIMAAGFFCPLVARLSKSVFSKMCS